MYQVADGILTLTLNRPDQLNAFSNRWLFQSIDQGPGIQVIHNACTNLLQLGYFCVAKVKDIPISK